MLSIRALMAGLRKVGVAPALLIVLLSVRVATAAAVDCQHELADAARAAERAQEALRIEALALGGELCLVEENPAQPAPTEAAHDHDGPHLGTPCPFFKSPAALTDISVDPAARIVTFSYISARTDVPGAAAQIPCAAYSPRAPPLTAQG
ncbi:hypothetical protein RA2_01593 [Roseovarius sp. A-2]|uniref:hypothetical protein n=1 Tax=Roseovarius sp. A-2 TaxID=1570360 RepID=UPI0009CC6A0B|nr:hypothetical protein [Roseovarius sp. A-2]GAW34543.1 hypothetical protein RA2_01593 [Roseovarius sp. A-2]